jgi:hypothetical protein
MVFGPAPQRRTPAPARRPTTAPPDDRAVILAAAQKAHTFAVTRAGSPEAQPALAQAQQLAAVAPLWATFRRAPDLDGSSPVSSPVITSSGLTASHTEGAAVTPGAINATGTTSLPTGVYGEVIANREALGTGGDRFRQVLGQEVATGHLRSVERHVASVLDAATPAATITLTGSGTAKAANLITQTAGIQLATGDLLAGQVLALDADLAAFLLPLLDSAGQPVWPGVVAALGAVGVTPVICPALVATWLLPVAAFGAWGSAPYSLDLETGMATITLASVGYAYAAVTRPGDVRKVV